MLKVPLHSYTANLFSIIEACIKNHPNPFIADPGGLAVATAATYFRLAKREIANKEYLPEDQAKKVLDYQIVANRAENTLTLKTSAVFLVDCTAQTSKSNSSNILDIEGAMTGYEATVFLTLLNEERIKVCVRTKASKELIEELEKLTGDFPNTSISIEDGYVLMF